MTHVDRGLAIQTAEENNSLRSRVKRLDEEEEQRNASNNNNGEALDTTSADRLKSKNNALRDEIAELQHELRELRTVNVTELNHQFQRLDGKRAYLCNENASLRNVLANQRKDVRRATNNVNAYQEVRRLNEEQNAFAKDDVKVFKERREAMQEKTHRLSRKEARLQNELASMPASSEDLETERQKLEVDNALKASQIDELEHLLEELKLQKEEQRQQSEEEGRRASEASSVDVSDLRSEYIELKGQLKELKQH